MGTPKPLPPRLQARADARNRHRLSYAHVQMARELGLNPAKLDNHRQEPWKAPLPQFIEDLYVKRFGREHPDDVKPSKRAHTQLNGTAPSAPPAVPHPRNRHDRQRTTSHRHGSGGDGSSTTGNGQSRPRGGVAASTPTPATGNVIKLANFRRRV